MPTFLTQNQILYLRRSLQVSSSVVFVTSMPLLPDVTHQSRVMSDVAPSLSLFFSSHFFRTILHNKQRHMYAHSQRMTKSSVVSFSQSAVFSEAVTSTAGLCWRGQLLHDSPICPLLCSDSNMTFTIMGYFFDSLNFSCLANTGPLTVGSAQLCQPPQFPTPAPIHLFDLLPL